jgi:hypothetical protein
MQSNLSVTPYRPAFQANVHKDFINAACIHYNKQHAPQKFERFMQKVRAFEKNYGTNDVTVVYDKVNLNGKTQHVLYAVKDGMKPGEYIVLSVKDQFRKLVEKFMHINEYEYTMKMAQ